MAIQSSDEHVLKSTSFTMSPQGPFDLINTTRYFDGWCMNGLDQSHLVMAFPVEGWESAAAVTVHQNEQGMIAGEVVSTAEAANAAWQQALAVFSLDADGSSWPEVGERDPFVGRLQHSYQFLRPVLFHSPYEAAASFIISHRISVRQGRNIRREMARELGEQLHIGEQELYAFPQPQVLAEITSFPGLSTEKIERLRGVARVALDGLLDRTYLRSLPVEQALTQLRSLRGVGEFFAQGILMRGAGLVDEPTNEDIGKQAVQLGYALAERPNWEQWQGIAEAWRPYRMWVNVLLHVWMTREHAASHRQGRRA